MLLVVVWQRWLFDLRPFLKKNFTKVEGLDILEFLFSIIFIEFVEKNR